MMTELSIPQALRVPSPVRKSMNLVETIRLAIQSLRVNRVRSALTTLGIVLGVAALVCMVAVGEGARSQISKEIDKLGTNLLFIEPYSYVAGARHALTEDEAAAMLRDIPRVEVSAPIIWVKVQVIASNRHWGTTVWGNDGDYLIARDWSLISGRLFNREEIGSGAKVAIIGQVIADKLFDGEPRMDATMRINNVPFTVIGVLERKGESGSGKPQDDIVIIPLRAARSRVLGAQQEIDPDEDQLKLTGDLNNEKKPERPISYPHQANYQALDYLVIKYATSASARQVRQAVEDVLRARRGTARGMENDFGIFDPAEALEVQEATAKSFSWLLAAIASISLAVGGIS